MTREEELVGAAEGEAEVDMLRVRKEAQTIVLGRERERGRLGEASPNGDRLVRP